MPELNAQATLLDVSNLGGPTTTLARADIEEALRSEEPPDLFLGVSRAGSERTIAVSWQRQDLERVLRDATSDRVQLTFDRSQLEEAFEDDVEAHGLRQKALVLGVALTTAAAAAGGASGMVVGSDGGTTSSPAAPPAGAPPAAGDPGTSVGDVASAGAAIGAGAIVIGGAAFAVRSRRRLQAT